MADQKSKLFDRVKSLDLYAILGVESAAEEKLIRKAHKEKCLLCLPDESQLLSDALEVLTDEKSRAVYDNLREKLEKIKMNLAI